MRRLVVCVLALVGVLAVRACVCRTNEAPGIRIATFNIENFPKHARQIEGAFAEIAKLDAPIVGVQEIKDLAVFRGAARAKLGHAWDIEFLETGSVLGHHLAVLYDTKRYQWVATRVHNDTRLGSTFKPVLDVELKDVRGQRLRVLVLHFKAGFENRPVRQRQHEALRRIIAEVKASGLPVVVLGDFNATSEADREDLRRAGLNWLTEPLACTAFLLRSDRCPRGRLDHVLSTQTAREVRAAGGCETDGCEARGACPLYATEVSDHCPVVVELARASSLVVGLRR